MVMMAPIATSLVVPMASSMIQPVACSLISAITEKTKFITRVAFNDESSEKRSQKCNKVI